MLRGDAVEGARGRTEVARRMIINKPRHPAFRRDVADATKTRAAST
jgi:hypothetical protein